MFFAKDIKLYAESLRAMVNEKPGYNFASNVVHMDGFLLQIVTACCLRHSGEIVRNIKLYMDVYKSLIKVSSMVAIPIGMYASSEIICSAVHRTSFV